MTKSEILSYLEENQDARGIAHWESRAGQAGGLKSYGIGLTKLRAFAKGIAKDATLARELWQSVVYEMKIISLLVDDPKSMTLEQVEKQVEELDGGYLAHVFSSCGATLAKTNFVGQLAEQWMTSDDPVRRRCGYGLLYEISKDKRKSAPGDGYFLEHLDRISSSWSGQPVDVLMSMAVAVQGIGIRNKDLHGPALSLAREIGDINFDPKGGCDPYSVEKNLTSDYVRKKFGF